MYIKILLCKTQDDTLVLAVGPALDGELGCGKEVIICDFTGNVTKKATIVRGIDVGTDSQVLRFILESHRLNWNDLFEVTHIVDYKEVRSVLNT